MDNPRQFIVFGSHTGNSAIAFVGHFGESSIGIVPKLFHGIAEFVDIPLERFDVVIIAFDAEENEGAFLRAGMAGLAGLAGLASRMRCAW